MLAVRCASVALLLAAACGSRTDLLGPFEDAGPIDASADARVTDASVDASPDAGPDATPMVGNFGYVIARASPALSLASLATAVLYQPFPSSCPPAIHTGRCAVAPGPGSP